jgi:hypothetical protein
MAKKRYSTKTIEKARVKVRRIMEKPGAAEEFAAGFTNGMEGTLNADDQHYVPRDAWDLGFWAGHYQRLILRGEAEPNEWVT